MTDSATTDRLVFDKGLLRRRWDRSLALFNNADFLVQAASEDLSERLAVILRQFDMAIDLTPTGGIGVDTLKRSGKVGTTIALAPTCFSADFETRAAPNTLTLTGDPEQLPIGAHSIDLAISLLGLQWMNDLPGTLIQVRRALKPDGLMLAALVGGSTLTELRSVLLEAETDVLGGASPRVAPFAELRDMGSLLQRAGFALPVVDSDTLTVRYATPMKLLQDLRAMGASNALVDRARVPMRRDVLFRTLELYQDRFADPDGRLRATFEIIWISGWAPHESQQQPLRPGSAKTRLADALGTTEKPAGEKAGR